MEFFPTRNKVSSIDKKLDEIASKFEDYTLFIADRFEKIEQNLSNIEQHNNDNTAKLNEVSEQLCSGTETFRRIFNETKADIQALTSKAENIIEFAHLIKEDISELKEEVSNNNSTLTNKVSEYSEKIQSYVKEETDEVIKEIAANSNFIGNISNNVSDSANKLVNNINIVQSSISRLEEKISDDTTSFISVFSDKYNTCSEQIKEILSSVDSNKLYISELKENLAKVYDKTDESVLISKKIVETVHKEFEFNTEVIRVLKTIEEKASAIKSLSNEKFNSVIKMLTDSLNNDEHILSEFIEVYSLFNKKSDTDGVIVNDLEILKDKLNSLQKSNQDHFSSVEDRQKKISELCDNVLSNIASVEEATRLLLVNNIINKIPKIK